LRVRRLGRLISKALNIVIVFFRLDQRLTLNITGICQVVYTTDLNRAWMLFGWLCSGVMHLAVLLARLVVRIVLFEAFTRRIGSKQVTTRHSQVKWILVDTNIARQLRLLSCVVVVVVRRLLASDQCPLLDRLVHHKEGNQWFKSQRESLPVAMLQLPTRQSSVHFKKLVLPPMVFDLPLTGHLAAGVFVVVVLKQEIQTLDHFVAE